MQLNGSSKQVERKDGIDRHIGLEKIESSDAMAFVNTQNQRTLAILTKNDMYEPIFRNCLDIYNSKNRIEYPGIRGEYVYNFWKDTTNPRGIWRRALKSEYMGHNHKWETLLDIDALSREENIEWVYKGSSSPHKDYTIFLIKLSRGGGDAVVTREFDMETKTFKKDGFVIGEGKNRSTWLDGDTLTIGLSQGDKNTTTSGYPRQVRIWKRGMPIDSTELIYEGNSDDVSVFGYMMYDNDDTSYFMVYRNITIHESEYFVKQDTGLIKLDIPRDAHILGLINNELILHLKSDWSFGDSDIKTGSLISLNFKKLITGKREVETIFSPSEIQSVDDVSITKNTLLLTITNHVKNELFIYTLSEGVWNSTKVNTPEFGTISVTDIDDDGDSFFYDFEDFLTPTTLYFYDSKKGKSIMHQSLPHQFDASKYAIEQFFAQSKDGTMVPYFMVGKKNMIYDGKNPTILYAYGGFGVSKLASYSGILGRSWLDNGGTYVLANIRGGGEYGPAWHQAGLKEKRQNVYDDFHAVAEDLQKRCITSSSYLGIKGGSNGGLLMGVAFTQRPDLYSAVICDVPLLDMERYHKLLAGASWMGEYGNPDIPEEWRYISAYSPYHNLDPQKDYPEVFFTTSTRDDRVHPGHARKMAAKMLAYEKPFLFYENTEGGHAGSSTNEQAAKNSALNYSYFLMKLTGA